VNELLMMDRETVQNM